MKITMFTPDGTVLKEQDYKINIPDYIQHFDPNHSFINITDEEMELINSKEESNTKSLLLDRLEVLIQHDYDNYTQSEYYDNETDLVVIKERLLQDPEVVELESLQSKFVSIFSGNPFFEKFQDTYTKESIEQLNNEKWILALLLKAISGYYCKGDHLSEMWDNVIHEYFTALDNFFKKFDQPSALDCQRYSYKELALHSQDTQKSLISLIKVLFNLKNNCRRHLYDLVRYSDFANSEEYNTSESVDSCLSCIVVRKNKKEKIRRFDYILKDVDGDDYATLQVEMDEIVLLYEYGGFDNDFVENMQPVFQDVYKEFKERYSSLWKQTILNFTHVENGIYYWNDSYKRLRKKYLDEYEHCVDEFHAQECFRFAVITGDKEDSTLLKFNGPLFATIFTMLRKNKEQDLIGLYEAMFKFNYLKMEVQRATQNSNEKTFNVYTEDEEIRFAEAKESIHAYLHPILICSAHYKFINHSVISSDEQFLSLIDRILEYDGIKPKIIDKSLYNESISSKFNGKLLYNILGVLRGTSKKDYNKFDLDQKYRVLNRDKYSAPAKDYIRSLHKLTDRDKTGDYPKHISQFYEESTAISLLDYDLIEEIKRIITNFINSK